MSKNKSFMYRLDLNRFDTWYLDLLEQTFLSQAHQPRDITLIFIKLEVYLALNQRPDRKKVEIVS